MVVEDLDRCGDRYTVVPRASSEPFFLLLRVGILVGVTAACGSETTAPPGPTLVIPELLAAPAMYDGYRMVSSYENTSKGEAVQFEGLALYNVTGPDGDIHLHLAAIDEGDVVCVFPASQMNTLAELATTQPKALVSMEGIVKGWEGENLIIDSCSIIP